MLNDAWAQIAAQRGDLFGWAPVLFGIGITGYFALPIEPSVLTVYSALALTAVLFAVLFVCSERVSLLVTVCALLCAGFGMAGLRTNMVAEPVLEFRYYGPIQGRIIEIDRSSSDAVRLTLDRVVLARMEMHRTPATVRVSLHGEQGFITPEPGQVVLMTGHLSSPSGPVEPGGFDFQRMAWFEGLGAVGYTRTPVLLGAEAAEGAAGLWVYRQRVAISAAVQGRLDGESGAFAAAIMTGDRSGMGQDSLTALRASNLAHLLAISGMHMGILAAFLFAALRYSMALWPHAALHWPVKKIAAIGALIAAAGYLALSGGNVSTERAFVMVAVMLVAVLFDRRALTLRAVAIAAMIVLTLRPEALFGPGFQMSFAATTALVAVFGVMRQLELPEVPRWLKSIGAVFVSSLVAGLATAPFAAFHFNQIAQFGLIANLLSVPLMGTLVMPAAVVATVLAPFGLEMIGLWVMDLGLRWILGVAHFVADQDGALRHVATPGPEVLMMIALGGLFVVLWQGWLRWLGVGPVIAAFALWQVVERPMLLVADTGSLIGVMTQDGRAVSKERGESFAVGNWLENDGAPVAQDVAYRRDGLVEEGRTVFARVGDARVLNVRGSTAVAALDGCGGADIIITNQELDQIDGCNVFDIRRLRQTGALAGYVENGTLTLIGAHERTGERIWNTASLRRRLFD
ncbi:competence protein ComEC [Octadecabacter temperatus]|uniref:ComEC family competence protein n=1 Tax=Octadecabacter temperatus TaxID=1458307 RepID=A0A0K0Y5I4_9RHOB|nr:ComEC/Rec2 family competence protein [Octadecabacter temperatus]AKS46214.1 ComEC family competence protein [Octadecabacter temperatus]SIO09816.1 competence protein ComEC [Octadecabacter temperatus]